MLFYRGRRGLALERFDVGRDRDRLDVFNVLISGTLAPGQKLLNGAVVRGPGMRVPKSGIIVLLCNAILISVSELTVLLANPPLFPSLPFFTFAA